MKSFPTTEVNMIEQLQGAEPGDLVVVHGHRVGDSQRTGEILEVLGEPAHPHFKVLWEDGRESVFYPSNDVVLRRKGGGS